MDKTSSTELVEAGPKRDQRGRRISTAEEREALLAAYRRSGLTQRVFAQREGLNCSTFTSWLHAVRGAPRPARTTAAASPPVRFVEASLPTAPYASGRVPLGDVLIITSSTYCWQLFIRADGYQRYHLDCQLTSGPAAVSTSPG